MKILILTAIPVEYKAIRNFLHELEEIETLDGTLFEEGKYKLKEKDLDIIIAQCGVGNINSSLYTERAIKQFNPSLIVFVGIAGGIKDVKLGDVVVADKIYSYEGLKDKKGLQSRPDSYKCTYSIVERAKKEATTNEWVSTISEKPFNVFIGPICVGEKVLSDKKSTLYNFIKKHYNDSLAVEMESIGFVKTAHSNNFENIIVIRGISDLIENKETCDENGYQQIASDHAAEFTFNLISKIWKKIRPRLSSLTGVKISFKETIDKKNIDELISKIKTLTGDMDIEVENVTYGSTNIYLKISEKSADILKKAIENGELKKEVGYTPKSIKSYLLSDSIDNPILFEFNRFFPDDKEIKEVYKHIQLNSENISTEFLNLKTPDLKVSCVMFTSHEKDFDFLTTKRMRIINTGAYASMKQSHYIPIIDFVRSQSSINENFDFASTFDKFRKDVKNDNIAIFKSSLGRVHEAAYRLLIHLFESSTNENTITKSLIEIENKLHGVDGYVIVQLNSQLKDFKRADKLMIDPFISDLETEK